MSKNESKVVILTEGSTGIGFGHITRCASLYQAFEEKGIEPHFIINGDETVNDLLKNREYSVFNWLNERERLFGFIKDADAVIIDSYLADYDLYQKVFRVIKLPVLIEDNRRIDYPKGIVVNGAINADELSYPEKDAVIYLLGSKYVPLRKEFWDVPEKEIKENMESIMITFGGADMQNMTPAVLRLLVDKYPALLKKAIIGKGFKDVREIERLKDNKTELIYYPDAERMKEAMLESDIAISAGGQTLYELARVGVPTIAMAVADNQFVNVKGWQKAGFIEYAGWWEDEGIFENIVKSMAALQNKDLRKRMSEVGRSLIDGQGARRVIQEISNWHGESKK